MSEIKTGGQAFPSNYTLSDGALFIYNGMTLRDYFAGLAMQGILANPQMLGEVAKAAYEIADAMLAEREKGE